MGEWIDLEDDKTLVKGKSKRSQLQCNYSVLKASPGIKMIVKRTIQRELQKYLSDSKFSIRVMNEDLSISDASFDDSPKKNRDEKLETRPLTESPSRSSQ